MWLFAVEGFVSVVAVHGSTDRLLVRGRVREDVAHWRKLVSGRSRPVVETPNADYRWRFVTTRARLAKAVSKLVLKGVQYDNFKNAVGHDDHDRAHAYMVVWAAMARLQQSK